MENWSRCVAAVTVSTAVVTAAGLGAAPAYAQSPPPAEAAWLDDLVGDCPDLFALGLQGTTETSPDAPVKADTGMLGTVMSPMLSQARELGASVDRAYVPYPGSFGGITPGGTDSYAVSVAKGEENLTQAATTVLAKCPKAKLAVVGFSQGAHAASNFLRSVGKGSGAVPASTIAAGALFGAPTRSEGAGLFPGTSQQTPTPVPGTRGEEVGALAPVSFASPKGAGIGPVSDVAKDYGSLSGRVSSWCQTGDLACDAPPNAPIARAVVNVAGQAEIGGDPFVAVTTIGRALASTTFKTAVDVINKDIQAPKNALENISIQPKKTISQRLAEASDPRAKPPTGQEVTSALVKVGLIGLNAAVTVAKKVLTPETIAAVATVGLANPPAAMAILAAKAVSVLPELIPPATTQRLVTQTFKIVQSELKANRDTFDLVALSSYRNTAVEHGSYGSIPATPTGQAPTKFVASWLAAAAADLGSSSKTSSTSTTKATSAARPTTVTTSPKPTTTTSTSTTISTAPTTTTSTTSATTTTSRDESEPALIEQGGVGIANSDSNS
ncbi:cutinase family protein [Prescottella equi]|uniref:cutinase family protein n=1 Tax=Rhodococcus hoagii TaxID=43767 RepID=UPI001EEB7959|nr:cutinase family protein [Prescottella equi]